MATPRRLTDEYIKSLPNAPLRNGRPSYILHQDIGRNAVGGLRLRVTTGGVKSWVLSARFPSAKNGERHNPSLRKIGRWPDVTLDKAREIAAEWNRDIRQGVDPQERIADELRDRRAKRREEALREEARNRAGTFANVAEAYIQRRVSKMRNADEVARRIRKDLVFRWGSRPVTEISKTDVIERDPRKGCLAQAAGLGRRGKSDSPVTSWTPHPALLAST